MKEKEDLLVSKNRVKVFLQQNGVRTSIGIYKALDAEIKSLLSKAVKRAKGNRRLTVMACDI